MAACAVLVAVLMRGMPDEPADRPGSDESSLQDGKKVSANHSGGGNGNIKREPKSADEVHPRRDLATDLRTLKTAGGEKLLEYFERGFSSSATFEDMYLASMVHSFCTGYVNPAGSIRRSIQTQIEGGFIQPEDDNVALMMARVDLMAERCAPLSKVGSSRWREAGGRLGQMLQADGSLFAEDGVVPADVEGASEKNLADARRNARDAIDRYGAVALEWKWTSLLAVAQAAGAQGATINFQGTDEVNAVAAMIAPCFAGQPCGPYSLPTLGVCIGTYGRDCTESVVDSTLKVLETTEERDQARKLAEEIAAAAQARNWPALGLE